MIEEKSLFTLLSFSWDNYTVDFTMWALISVWPLHSNLISNETILIYLSFLKSSKQPQSNTWKAWQESDGTDNTLAVSRCILMCWHMCSQICTYVIVKGPSSGKRKRNRDRDSSLWSGLHVTNICHTKGFVWLVGPIYHSLLSATVNLYSVTLVIW